MLNTLALRTSTYIKKENIPLLILYVFYTFSCFFGVYLLLTFSDVKNPSFPFWYRLTDEILFILFAISASLYWKVNFSAIKNHFQIILTLSLFAISLAPAPFVNSGRLTFEYAWFLKNAFYGMSFFLLLLIFPKMTDRPALRTLFYILGGSLLCGFFHFQLYFPISTFNERMVGCWTNPNAMGLMGNFFVSFQLFLFYKNIITKNELRCGILIGTSTVIFSLSLSSFALLLSTFIIFAVIFRKEIYELWRLYALTLACTLLSVCYLYFEFPTVRHAFKLKLINLSSQVAEMLGLKMNVEIIYTSIEARKISWERVFNFNGLKEFLLGSNHGVYVSSDSSLINILINFGFLSGLLLIVFFTINIYRYTIIRQKHKATIWLFSFVISFLLFNLPLQYQFEAYPTCLFAYLTLALINLDGLKGH